MALFDGKIGANAALDFGGNILTMGLNHFWQKKQLSQSEQWAREDATTAYNRMIEQWNRENAYNTPKAQMQRALEAGLNPNLYLAQQGLGNGSIGTPTVPQAASAGGDAYTSPTGLTSFVDAEYKQALIDDLESSARNRDKITDGQLERWLHENNVSDVTIDELRSAIDVNNARVNEINASSNKMKAEFDLLKEDEKAKKFENYITEHTMKLSIEAKNKESEAVIKTALALSMANVANVKADTALKIAQKDLAREGINLTKEQEKEARALSHLYNTQIVGEQAKNNTAKERLSQIKAVTAQMFPDEDASFISKINGRLVRDFYTMKEINPFSISLPLNQ